jgi:hypothetical protein
MVQGLSESTTVMEHEEYIGVNPPCLRFRHEALRTSGSYLIRKLILHPDCKRAANMAVGNAFTFLLVVKTGSEGSVSCTRVLKIVYRNTGYV